jgi:hypothetical protein
LLGWLFSRGVAPGLLSLHQVDGAGGGFSRADLAANFVPAICSRPFR